MLALNVVARTNSLFIDLLQRIEQVFKECEIKDNSDSKTTIYLLKVSNETANTTVLIIKGGKKVVPQITGNFIYVFMFFCTYLFRYVCMYVCMYVMQVCIYLLIKLSVDCLCAMYVCVYVLFFKRKQLKIML
jgi:hypothetical protein